MNVLKKLTLKDLKLNIKRTVATIVGIMLSTALVTSVVTMYTSGLSSFEQNQRNTKGNFHLALYNVSNEQINEIKNNREIEQIYFDEQLGYAKLDGIKNADKPYVCIKAMNKESMQNLTVHITEGRLPENENEIVIPTHLKTNGRVDLKVGESITLNVGARVYNDLVLDQNDPLQQSDIYNDLQSEDEKARENAQKALSEAKENEEAEKLLESPEKIINTEEKTYKIVGIIERPSVYVEPFTAPGYTFITYTNLNLNGILEKSKNGSNSNQPSNESNTSSKYKINLYAHFNEKHISKIYKNIAGVLNVSPELYEKSNKENEKLTQEEQEKLSDELSQSEFKEINLNEGLINSLVNPLKKASNYKMIIYVAIIICIVIMLASIYCIKNSFDISITEKTKQYGILRSVGATKKQIRKNVFYEATILGIFGIPLGIIFGILATFILLKVSNYYIESFTDQSIDLKLATSFAGIIISAILGIITVYFSAFRSAKKATKVSPIDSIRNNNDVKISSKEVKSPKYIKKFWGIGGEISYKNLKRNKKKYHTTTVSLVVSIILFIASVGFSNIMYEQANYELTLSDYNLSLFTSVEPNNTAKFNKFVNTTKLDNIEDYSIRRGVGLYFKNAKLNQEFVDFSNMYVSSETMQYISIITVGNEQYQKYLKKLGLNYDDMKNKAILMDYIRTGHQNENEMKIQYKTLHQYNYKVGDEISGTIYESAENYKVGIGYVTDVRPFGFNKSMEEAVLIVSDEEYNKIPRGNKAEALNIYYKSNNANKLQDDIDKMLQGENYGTENIEEIVKKQSNIVTFVNIFLYGFIIVISLIGITNIFNTITANMELRKPEFAMLKSVGMTKNEFNKMIKLESMFMGTKSLLIGIPIGIIINYLMYFIMADGSNIHFKFPFIAILVSICVVFILIFAIMRYSINKVNKQNIIETIRNENI